MSVFLNVSVRSKSAERGDSDAADFSASGDL
jgi:hypothetical protein